jgi:hypothetical protein
MVRGGRGGCDIAPFPKKDMPDDLGLLLETIRSERLARRDPVAVAAERMTHERQEKSAVPLSLPDMGHFVDEKALPAR